MRVRNNLAAAVVVFVASCASPEFRVFDFYEWVNLDNSEASRERVRSAKTSCAVNAKNREFTRLLHESIQNPDQADTAAATRDLIAEFDSCMNSEGLKRPGQKIRVRSRPISAKNTWIDVTPDSVLADLVSAGATIRVYRKVQPKIRMSVTRVGTDVIRGEVSVVGDEAVAANMVEIHRDEIHWIEIID